MIRSISYRCLRPMVYLFASMAQGAVDLTCCMPRMLCYPTTQTVSCTPLKIGAETAYVPVANYCMCFFMIDMLVCLGLCEWLRAGFALAHQFLVFCLPFLRCRDAVQRSMRVFNFAGPNRRWCLSVCIANVSFIFPCSGLRSIPNMVTCHFG